MTQGCGKIVYPAESGKLVFGMLHVHRNILYDFKKMLSESKVQFG